MRSASFSTAGGFAAVAAIAEIVVGVLAIAGKLPMPSGLALVLALLLYGASIYPLARFPLPNGLRAVLILGLIVVILGAGVRADLFGLRRVNQRIENAIEDKEVVATPSPTALSDPDQDQDEPGHAAVSMQLRDAPAGSGGWAQRLNQVGLTAPSGPQIAIAGTVEFAHAPTGNRLNIAWTISMSGTPEPCGVMTAFASGTEVDTRALIATFRRAVDRTVMERKAACY